MSSLRSRDGLDEGILALPGLPIQGGVLRMREAYIARVAAHYGLDPKAVLAVAGMEGLSGGVGDGGHAFGPFQLNDAGGVLTNAPSGEHSNAWAWSNAGINFALQRMASVARGTTGRQAVNAIVSRFERPANPSAEIQGALARLGQSGNFKGMAAGSNFQQVGSGSKQPTAFDPAVYAKQAAALMVQDAVARAQGQPTAGPTALVQSLLAAKQAATTRVQAASGPQKNPNGFLASPGSGGSGFGDKAVRIASKQLGQPYVWGGESRAEGGFDCSGLIQWTYARMGINLPRTAAEQGKAGRAVPYANLKKGDLLVENNGQHVVMYAGNGQVIAAPHTGTNVQMQPLSYFPPDQYNARRIG